MLRRGIKSSIEIFGTYIHKYKFNEAVEDKVVLDLRYEARDVPQDIPSQEKIDHGLKLKQKASPTWQRQGLKSVGEH